MRTEVFNRFHGAWLNELTFNAVDEPYKRILFLPGKCYFALRAHEKIWPEAIKRVLREHGIVFVQVEDSADWDVILQGLQESLNASLCTNCTSDLHFGKDSLYSLITAQSGRKEVTVVDSEELMTQLNESSLNALPQKSNTWFRDYLQLSPEAELEIGRLANALEYKQFCFLAPGVVMIIDNQRYLYGYGI